MKREQLIRELLQRGCQVLRHGGRHDIYINPATGQKQPIPRHGEVDNALANHIRKFLGLKG